MEDALGWLKGTEAEKILLRANTRSALSFVRILVSSSLLYIDLTFCDRTACIRTLIA